MNRKSFVSITALAALALATGASALAADPASAGAGSSGLRNPGLSYVDHNGKGGLKDIVVESGTDPGVVELQFTGAQKVTFDNVGMLLIIRKDGSLWRYKPTAWQMIDGKRKDVTVGFHFIGGNRVSLRVRRLDASAPLIIGPVDGRNGNS